MDAYECFMQTEFGGAWSRDQNFTGQKVDEFEPIYLGNYRHTAYGDVAMKRGTCFRWHKRFKNGRLSVEDDEGSGRPSTSTDDPHIDEINTLVRANRRLTVRELAEECGISVGSCHHILTEELKDASRCCKTCATSDDK